jgi:hypothetical protein
MPQFDFYSFFSQVVGLTAAVVFFYLIFLKFFLVKSTETLKMRKKLDFFYQDISSSAKESINSYLSQVLLQLTNKTV